MRPVVKIWCRDLSKGEIEKLIEKIFKSFVLRRFYLEGEFSIMLGERETVKDLVMKSIESALEEHGKENVCMSYGIGYSFRSGFPDNATIEIDTLKGTSAYSFRIVEMCEMEREEAREYKSIVVKSETPLKCLEADRDMVIFERGVSRKHKRFFPDLHSFLKERLWSLYPKNAHYYLGKIDRDNFVLLAYAPHYASGKAAIFEELER